MSTLSFSAVANAQVRGDQPTTVLGNTGDDVRVDDGAPKYAFFRFDITGIPTGATINSATLTVKGTADAFDTSAVRVHAVADNTWSESTITYNNAPTINSTVLDTENLGTNVTANYTIPSTALPSGNGLVSFGLTRTASGTDTRICSRTHPTTGNRPSLVVDYTLASNVAPTVNAGSDQTVTLPGTASLDATVSDPDSVETVQWTKQSGPGTVSFASDTSVDTTATFSAAGTYVLRLTASDGVNTPVYDEVTITVNAGSYGIETFSYTGSWTTAGPANEAPEKYTKVVNSEATIQAVVGTGGGTVSLKGFKGAYKGIAGIKVDGGTETTITQYATARSNATFWTSGSLTAGTHTIVVRCTGTKDTASADTTISISGASITNGTLQTPSTPPANLPPTVSIAAVSTVTMPGTATLNGTVTDPESQPVTGSWSQISGPGLVIFTDPALIDTTASFDTPGTYILRLTGTDGVNSDTADVTVTVQAAPDTRLADAITHTEAALGALQETSPALGVAQEELGNALSLVNSLAGDPAPNIPPEVSAGIDQTILISGAVTLDGTATDADGTPVAVVWSKQSGPGDVSFGDPTAVDTTATFSATGTYVLRLTGTDGTATATDDTTITVNAVPSSPVTVSSGPDQSITLPSGVTLDGTVTGTGTLTGSWSKVSGPTGATVTFANQNAIDTTATFSAAGVYVLRLTGTNGTSTATDDMQVSVAPAPVNNPPTVSAGPDKAVTLPNPVTLSGTATDPEGTTLTVLWTKQSGPGDVAFANPNVRATTATFTAQGTYVLRLTASDGVNTAYDEVSVTANPTPPPSSGTTFGIGATASYIASLPMSGAGWTNLLSQANAPADLIYLNDASTGWPGGAVAAALAYVRAPSTYGNLRTKVLNFLEKAQNTNPADWWHAAANRNLAQLALAGELVGKEDTAWINWLKAQMTTPHVGGPSRSEVMITCAWDWPNNHGAAALMSVAGIYAVLGTQTETLAGNPAGLVPAMKWLKGFCGDHSSTGFPSIRSTNPTYTQGMGVGDIPQSDTWQLNPNDPYGIVPNGTTKRNGSIPADVCRGSGTSLSSYPNAGSAGLDHYVAGNLTRRVGAAIFLSKALNDTSIWTTGNSALKRARDWMNTYSATMTSPHSWADPALNTVYGTSYAATNIGNEQWLGGTQWLASGGGWPFH